MNKITKNARAEALKGMGASIVSDDGITTTGSVQLSGISIRVTDILFKPKKKLLKRTGSPKEVELQVEFLNNGKIMSILEPIIISKGCCLTIMTDDAFKCSQLVIIS